MFRLENLYLILDVRLEDSDGTPSPTSTPSNSDVNDSDDDDGVQLDDDEGITEIRFCPEDTAKLQEMFDAMTHCQVRILFIWPVSKWAFWQNKLSLHCSD